MSGPGMDHVTVPVAGGDLFVARWGSGPPVLAVHGISAVSHRPKRTEEVLSSGWDVVITVCDQARQACPVFPEATLTAPWGVEDPVGAPNEVQAFEEVFQILSRRIDEFLSLPLDTLDPEPLRIQLNRIGWGD